MPDYLSVKETAEKLDITPAAVRALIQKGELEGAFQTPSRAWVIPAEAVRDYKAGQHDRPQKPRKPATRSKRETTRKSEGAKKRPAGEKKETTRRRKRKSTGFGLDDILDLISERLAQPGRSQGGSLIATLLEQFIGQKHGAGSEQLQSLLSTLGEQDPGLLQDILKSASAPDLASLLEKLKPQQE